MGENTMEFLKPGIFHCEKAFTVSPIFLLFKSIIIQQPFPGWELAAENLPHQQYNFLSTHH